MKHMFLLFFGTLLCFNAAAQKNYMHEKAVKSADMAFPIFSLPADTATVQKINTNLQLRELMLLHGHEQKNIFEQVTINDGGLYGAKTDLRYTVTCNNERVLSIHFDEAADGMTTHYWQSYFTFNAKNGDQLYLTDIFTPEGLKTFTAMVLKERKQDFQHDKKAGKLKQDVYDNNESCFTELNNEWFYISDNTLFIDGNNCLPKAYMFDDVPLQENYSFKQLQPLLNDYGKALFTPGADVTAYRSYHHPQIMSGLINDKYPIYFIMTGDSEYVSAVYAYAKIGIGIALDGTLKNGNIELTEQDGKGNERAVITAKVTKEEITGTWTDKKHTYAFHVKKW